MASSITHLWKQPLICLILAVSVLVIPVLSVSVNDSTATTNSLPTIPNLQTLLDQQVTSVLNRQNASGLLPNVTWLNQLLGEGNGQGAIQFGLKPSSDNSTTPSFTILNLPNLPTVQAANRANSPSTTPSSSVVNTFATTAPPNPFAINAATDPSASSSVVNPFSSNATTSSTASNPFGSSSNPFTSPSPAVTTPPGANPATNLPPQNIPPTNATTPTTPPLPTTPVTAGPPQIFPGLLSYGGAPITAPELVAAYRAIDFAVLDALYGYLEYVGYQITVVGFILTPVSVPVSSVVLAIGAEFLGIGYLGAGIKGSIEIEAAIEALYLLLTKPAPAEPAAAPAASVLINSSPTRQAAAATIGTPTPAGELNVPLIGFRTVSAPDSSSTYSFGPTSSSSLPFATPPPDSAGFDFPSFLYSSWIRIENDTPNSFPSDSFDTYSSSTDSLSSSTVLLQFSSDSYERLESHRLVDGRRQIKKQRCFGVRQLECEWSEKPTAASTSNLTQQTTPSVNQSFATLNTTADSSTTPPTSPFTTLESQFALPLNSQANIAIQYDQCGGGLGTAGANGNEVNTVRFVFLQLLYNGTLQSALIEMDGEKKAFIRM